MDKDTTLILKSLDYNFEKKNIFTIRLQLSSVERHYKVIQISKSKITFRWNLCNGVSISLVVKFNYFGRPSAI